MDYILHRFFNEKNREIIKISKSYFLCVTSIDIIRYIYTFSCVYFNFRKIDIGIFLDIIKAYVALKSIKNITNSKNINNGIVMIYSFNLISCYYIHINNLSKKILNLAINNMCLYFNINISAQQRENEIKNEQNREITEHELNNKAPLISPGINNINNIEEYNNISDADCCICLEKIDKRLARKLPCSHIYHAKCIEDWVLPHNNKCPLCRKNIVV
jgi:hypothetical protein